MNKKEIISQLKQKISDNILKDNNIEITNEASLISSGIIDSFSLVDLALIVEELFRVQIEDYELNSDCFDTLDQLADLIFSRLPFS